MTEDKRKVGLSSGQYGCGCGNLWGEDDDLVITSDKASRLLELAEDIYERLRNEPRLLNWYELLAEEMIDILTEEEE